MRLICPNCAAQYEVDDSAIPETGRDVQCSACGNAWFQLPPALEAALEHEEGGSKGAATHEGAGTGTEGPGRDGAADDDAPGDLPPADTPEASTPPESEPEPGAAAPAPGSDTTPPDAAADRDADDAAFLTPEEGQGAAQDDPHRRPIDESVLRVLREEAERETAARHAEAEALESQPELGLSTQPRRPTRVFRGEEPQGGADTPGPDTETETETETESADSADRQRNATGATRRKQLPDIEEINSSLRPAAAHSAASGVPSGEDRSDPGRQRRRGFRIGFLTVFGLALLLLGLYFYAPALSEALPAAEPLLSAYVSTVDVWRVAFAERLDSAIRALTAAISDVGGA